MSNIIKGTNYEIYINQYLNDIDENNQSWMWKDIPENDLRNVGIIGDWNSYRLLRKDEEYKNSITDTGCDILLKSKKDEKYYIVQCKNYDSKNYVRLSDLAGFYMMMHHYQLEGMLYFTSKLSRHITDQKQTPTIQYIKKVFLEITQKENFNNLLSSPFDYQIEAYQTLKKCFTEQNRAILQLPCGLGKTLISMMIGLDYEQIVILSPLKQYCFQNLERYKAELRYKDYNGLIIDSDETRDIDYITQFIKDNKKIILSVCYKSCDVLYEVLDKLNNYIIIVDEFHNISKNEIIGLNSNGMNQVLLSDSKIMFMSATPRIYEIDDEDLSDEIFGSIEYSYNMGDAIKTKKICDYEVFVPDITLNNNIFIEDIQKEVDIHTISNEIVIKCNYLLRGMLETGARKCILYTRTHQEALAFKETFILINEYFAIELNVNTFLSIDNKSIRQQKLKEFTDFQGISILVSVELLNECIDIKQCDSVFITYWLKSITKYIQRISRSNRKDGNNINKISKIFLWLDEYSDMTDYITHLKDFDNSFCVSKVKIMSINNHSNLILERNHNISKYEVLDNFLLNVKQALTWDEKFHKLLKYIKEHGKIPSIGKDTDDNIELKQLAAWHQTQKKNYDKKTKIMKHSKYYDIWTNFMTQNPTQFLNHEEKWIQKLNLVRDYIIQYKDSPSRYSKDEYEKDLGVWIAAQKANCKSQVKMFSLGKYENILKLWIDFNTKFKKHLLTNEEKWNDRFDEVKQFIDTFNKLPIHKRNEKDSLGLWVTTQNKNYKIKKQIMSNPIFYELWHNLINDNQELFLSKDEIWLNDLTKVKEFIKETKHRPNKNSSNIEEKRLGNWLQHQCQNLRNDQYSMKTKSLKQEFESFVKEYEIS
jgi:superfamily II DNA or RNA helicase